MFSIFDFFLLFSLLLLLIGGIQDWKYCKISRRLNYVLLVSIIVAVVLRLTGHIPTKFFITTGFAIVVVFAMYLTRQMGGADVKFLLLMLFTLPFNNPWQPLLFLLFSLITWVAFPTKEDLKTVDWKITMAILLITIFAPPVGIFFATLFFGSIKALKSKYDREPLPFLHVLFIVVILHLIAPDRLYHIPFIS